MISEPRLLADTHIGTYRVLVWETLLDFRVELYALVHGAWQRVQGPYVFWELEPAAARAIWLEQAARDCIIADPP